MRRAVGLRRRAIDDNLVARARARRVKLRCPRKLDGSCGKLDGSMRNRCTRVSAQRLRGGGCAPSQPIAFEADEKAAEKPHAERKDLVKLASGGFACSESPLFKEYLGLLGAPQPVAVGAITPRDALLVIDMQRDFAPKSATNPDGGRFGVAEGEHIVPCIEQLIHHVRARSATPTAKSRISHSFILSRFARSSTNKAAMSSRRAITIRSTTFRSCLRVPSLRTAYKARPAPSF